MDNPQAYLGRLKPIHIFKGLTDDQILEAARELELETHAPGEIVIEEGDEGQFFYIIHRGQVKVLRRVRGAAPRQVATLVAGDYFGESSLLYGRRRSATVEADTQVELLRLSKEDFDNLLRRYPQIRPNLLVSTESREVYRRLNFSWLGPSEVVYLIARRHKVLLYQSLLLPVVITIVVVAAAFGLGVYFDWTWALWISALGGLPLAGWIWWTVVDWGNDFYIVTNRRVVYLEKIVGIYDSRQEAPLGSILSVNVQSAGSLERLLGIGDVIVRTFSGPIVMKSVANPNILAAMIEEYWNRTKTRERESEYDAMKKAVRRQIEVVQAEAPKPAVAQAVVKVKPLAARLSSSFSLKVRFEQGDSVIYRKHWYLLLHDIWRPSLFILLLAGVLGLALSGLLPAFIPLPAAALVVFVVFIPLAGWWLYEYVDWKNDIYQVTSDQILDIRKKPFGAETRKAAPLGNVLSLKYERPGLLGLLLNFGTVVATVGGTEFRFEGVFDPVGVQNDIYRRIEAQNAKKAQAESAKKRDEIADWLGVYHTVLTEMKNEDAQRQKPA